MIEATDTKTSAEQLAEVGPDPFLGLYSATPLAPVFDAVYRGGPNQFPCLRGQLVEAWVDRVAVMPRVSL